MVINKAQNVSVLICMLIMTWYYEEFQNFKRLHRLKIFEKFEKELNRKITKF